MKKFAAICVAGLLSFNFALADQPTDADQKWLSTVEKMVSKGDSKVSTPRETRVELLKSWAVKNGYTAKVTKTDAGYSIELSGRPAKGIAQK